jgi:hypothetical protein
MVGDRREKGILGRRSKEQGQRKHRVVHEKEGFSQS